MSTLEKLGCELLLDELPEADEGEDDEEDDGLLDEPLDDLDVSFATARDDNAKSTAAAVILRDFGMDETSVVVGPAPHGRATAVPMESVEGPAIAQIAT